MKTEIIRAFNLDDAKRKCPWATIFQREKEKDIWRCWTINKSYEKQYRGV